MVLLYLFQPYLAGVILAPGSESNIPVTLQVIKHTAAKQKMKPLVPYMIRAGQVKTDLVDMVTWWSSWSLLLIGTGQFSVTNT